LVIEIILLPGKRVKTMRVSVFLLIFFSTPFLLFLLDVILKAFCANVQIITIEAVIAMTSTIMTKLVML